MGSRGRRRGQRRTGPGARRDDVVEGPHKRVVVNSRAAEGDAIPLRRVRPSVATMGRGINCDGHPALSHANRGDGGVADEVPLGEAAVASEIVICVTRGRLGSPPKLRPGASRRAGGSETTRLRLKARCAPAEHPPVSACGSSTRVYLGSIPKPAAEQDISNHTTRPRNRADLWVSGKPARRAAFASYEGRASPAWLISAAARPRSIFCSCVLEV
jgi:hypothetical protein